jgi:hypothetical protein
METKSRDRMIHYPPTVEPAWAETDTDCPDVLPRDASDALFFYRSLPLRALHLKRIVERVTVACVCVTAVIIRIPPFKSHLICALDEVCPRAFIQSDAQLFYFIREIRMKVHVYYTSEMTRYTIDARKQMMVMQGDRNLQSKIPDPPKEHAARGVLIKVPPVIEINTKIRVTLHWLSFLPYVP